MCSAQQAAAHLHCSLQVRVFLALPDAGPGVVLGRQRRPHLPRTHTPLPLALGLPWVVPRRQGLLLLLLPRKRLMLLLLLRLVLLLLLLLLCLVPAGRGLV